MEVMFWVWLAIIAISLIIEIITLDLVSIWFSFGALIPFILSAIGNIRIEIQISIFVVVTALLIIFIRKYAQRLLFKNMNTKTNINALEGKKCRLLEDTDFEHNGSVKVNDVVWTAVSKDGHFIKAGSMVEIISVDGNKLIIQEVNQDNKDEKSIEETKTEVVKTEKENVEKESNETLTVQDDKTDLASESQEIGKEKKDNKED